VVTLILSDVIGDPLDVIASGPTVADASTFAEANAVVGKYQLRDKLPLSVTAYLNKGLCGQAPETLKQGDEYLENCRHVIVANNRMALNAAYEKIFHFGEQASIVSTEWAGEARDSARALAQRARAELAGMRPHERRYLLCGGETTVTVCGNGRGGRNQEFALAFALEIAGERGIALLSAGTDGNDGPTDAAGAIVDGDTVAQAMQCGLDAQLALQQNDAYTFFQQLDACTGTQGHLKTGPTGTNVMDIQMVMLDKIDAGTRQ
ncbi:MAG: DUF4147 domain-containing protein, partial [Gammaproteobacteria bacterium]|nr:DUF4147 domain-containing protein [Gammaproteobacteria bacterium]